jgi:hypothetical protein
VDLARPDAIVEVRRLTSGGTSHGASNGAWRARSDDVERAVSLGVGLRVGDELLPRVEPSPA